MKTLIYDTLVNLANQEPEHHAKIRQNLYEQLDLPLISSLLCMHVHSVLQALVNWKVVKVSTMR